MKTKTQILEWLEKQPWKSEFYEAIFLSETNISDIRYDIHFIELVFDWAGTKQGIKSWNERNNEYRKWYDSENKPMSWEEYCEQNPITKDDWSIEYGEVFQMLAPIFAITQQERDPMTCVDVMSKEYCEAFVAYMKLFQLRNAWVKDEHSDDLSVMYKILYQDGRFDVFRVRAAAGLSFSNKEEAREFMDTFGDLLKTAKPLL